MPKKKTSRKPVKLTKKKSKGSTKEKTKKTSRKRRKKVIPFIKDHVLTLSHSKATQKEIKEILDKHKITVRDLPKIFKQDPAIRDLNLEEGDVVRIDRNSLTAGKAVFYREVINV